MWYDTRAEIPKYTKCLFVVKQRIPSVFIARLTFPREFSAFWDKLMSFATACVSDRLRCVKPPRLWARMYVSRLKFVVFLPLHVARFLAGGEKLI